MNSFEGADAAPSDALVLFGVTGDIARAKAYVLHALRLLQPAHVARGQYFG